MYDWHFLALNFTISHPKFAPFHNYVAAYCLIWLLWPQILSIFNIFPPLIGTTYWSTFYHLQLKLFTLPDIDIGFSVNLSPFCMILAPNTTIYFCTHVCGAEVNFRPWLFLHSGSSLSGRIRLELQTLEINYWSLYSMFCIPHTYIVQFKHIDFHLIHMTILIK